MAILTVRFDLDKKEYTVTDVQAGSVHDPIGDINYKDLYVLFGFTRGNINPVEFNNLKFGYNLRDMDNKAMLVHAISFPPVGIKYMRSNSDIIEHTKVSVVPGKSYRLDIWVQENYNETKHNVWFNMPSYSDYELDYVDSHPEQPDYQQFLSMRNDELDTRTY